MALRYYAIKNPASCLVESIYVINSGTRVVLDKGFVQKFYGNIFHFRFSEKFKDKIFLKNAKSNIFSPSCTKWDQQEFYRNI